MNVELWPIEKPIDYARNAKKITEADVDKMASILKEYGWRQPVVVDTDGVIVIGHLRRRAGQKLGWTECPVHTATDLTKAQIKGLRLADNRIGTEVKTDYELLALELGELKDEYNFDLKLTAFDEHEISPLLAADWSPAPIEDSEEHKPADKPSKQHENKIVFTDEQFDVIAKAVFRLRDVEQEKNISDGRALELICANFLADPNFEPQDEPESEDDGE